MSSDEHSAAAHCILIGLVLVLMQDAHEGLIISLCGMKALWRANPLPAVESPLGSQSSQRLENNWTRDRERERETSREIGCAAAITKEWKWNHIPVRCSWPFHWWAVRWILLYVGSELFLGRQNKNKRDAKTLDLCILLYYLVYFS